MDVVLATRTTRIRGPRPMSVGHMVLRHLFHLNGRNEDDLIAPYGASQDGIAEAARITRAHAAIELRRAVEKGYVEVLVRHVVHLPTRRKTYLITRRGIAALLAAEGAETCDHIAPFVGVCGMKGAV